MIKLNPLVESRPYEGILEGYHDDFRYDVIGSVSNTTAKTLCSMLGQGSLDLLVKRYPAGTCTITRWTCLVLERNSRSTNARVTFNTA
ncbi:hypothetical protein DPMN_068401 [Dreissena polymorpha]|uniref:Uncharacterized protein n=1 Tax=Dreissena polymorpha TaxID=45954 RepID=A0A9D3YXK4_DREPO|nr:hypothetical protein DPMN_068401 [Dreissena polymorpha]